MISRREFMAMMGLAGTSLFTGQCKTREEENPVAESIRVALSACDGYDFSLVLDRLREMFDLLGGITDLVKAGSIVGLKLNLTGGMAGDSVMRNQFGLTAPEGFWTHPVLARAVGRLLLDAGAAKIYILDGVFDDRSFASYGYDVLAEELGGRTIDLNRSAPYDDFVTRAIARSQIYPELRLNRLLTELDLYVSISKLKCHRNSGVSLGLKNSVGVLPIGFHKLNPEDGSRSELHGTGEEYRTRLPRAIVDIARAVPIHLSIIDGISTIDGGEGPWAENAAPVSPGVLIAGKDAVAVDATGTAVMGFDPEAAHYSSPFLNSENHLKLAREAGLGENRLSKIDLVGQSIDSLRYPFTPCPHQ